MHRENWSVEILQSQGQVLSAVKKHQHGGNHISARDVQEIYGAVDQHDNIAHYKNRKDVLVNTLSV